MDAGRKSAVYPERGSFFAHRFVRLLAKTCAANTIGPDGCWLLTNIALIEDVKRYRAPVSYWNGQLYPLIGLRDERALKRVRDRCIEAGWLHYVPATKSRAALYWVLVPEQYDDLPDGPIDEDPAQLLTNKSVGESGRERGGNVVGKEVGMRPHPILSLTQGTKSLRDDCVSEETKQGSKPKPKAKPKPQPVLALPKDLDTPEFRAAWDAWATYRRQSRKPLTDSTVSRQLAKLGRLGVSAAILAIEQSIENGWQGLFPPKETDNGKPERAKPEDYTPY